MAILQVSFDSTNVYTTYGMYVTDYKISPPIVKTHYVDIPFRDGSLDLTNTTGLHYENREIEIVFHKYLTHSQLPSYLAQMNALFNGGKKNITFSDDSAFHYIGRPMVKDYSMVGQSLAMLKVSAIVEPYKYDAQGQGVL